MNKEHKLLQGIIAVSVVLGTVCLTLMGILWGVVTKSNLYATQLENMYKRALYQLVGNVNDIELDISKAISKNNSYFCGAAFHNCDIMHITRP